MALPFRMGMILADFCSGPLNSLERLKVQKPQFLSTAQQIKLSLLDRLTNHLYLATKRNIVSAVALCVPPLD